MKIKYLSAFAIGATCLILPDLAGAQNLATGSQKKKTYEDSKSRLKVSRPRAALEDLGYVIGDGIILSPTISTEVGHDTNPDSLYSEPSSAYGMIDGSMVLGFVKPNQALTFALKSKFMELEGLATSERWDAGVTIDAFKRFANGIEISGGALHLHDAISFTENESTAGYVQAEYKNNFLESYGRAITHQVRYLSQEAIPSTIAVNLRPYYFNKEFNLQRTETTAGLLLYRNRMFAPYVEGGHASIDYTDQSIAALNRDARDYWGVAGIRFTLAPQLRADVGYRYNKRITDDLTISSHEADYVDARITWAPVNNFSAIYEVDRKIGEAMSAQSRLAEVTTHGISLQYKPSARLLYSIRAQQRRSVDQGAQASFRERIYQSETSFDLNNKSQLYLSTLWSQMKEEESLASYDRFKVAVGLRVKYNDAKSGPWASLVDELRALPIDNKILDTTISYNHMFLPTMRMMVITDPFLDNVWSHVTDHNGHVHGPRLDLAISEMTAPNVFGDTHLHLGLKGFYGRYRSTYSSDCNFTSTFDCLYINIRDVNLADDNNTGPFGRLLARTKKTVQHWGIAVESPLKREMTTGSMKDARKVIVPTPWRFGLSVKAIEQDTDLYAIDTSVPDPIDYDEELDTYYYGIYASFHKDYRLQEDLKLALTAEGGVYFADTNYDGYYVAYYPTGGMNYTIDRGTAAANKQKETFIGSLKFDLEKNLNWGKISLNGQAEYYSYVPRLKYNDDDLAGGGNLDINGTQRGTIITEGHAVSLSLGGRVSVPIEKIVQ